MYIHVYVYIYIYIYHNFNNTHQLYIIHDNINKELQEEECWGKKLGAILD